MKTQPALLLLWVVMLDADRPGSIVRFWLTTDRNKKGTLRFSKDPEHGSNHFPAQE